MHPAWQIKIGTGARLAVVESGGSAHPAEPENDGLLQRETKRTASAPSNIIASPYADGHCFVNYVQILFTKSSRLRYITLNRPRRGMLLKHLYLMHGTYNDFIKSDCDSTLTGDLRARI